MSAVGSGLLLPISPTACPVDPAYRLHDRTFEGFQLAQSRRPGPARSTPPRTGEANSENLALKCTMRDQETEIHCLADNLAAARENNRFADRRIADLSQHRQITAGDREMGSASAVPRASHKYRAGC